MELHRWTVMQVQSRQARTLDNPDTWIFDRRRGALLLCRKSSSDTQTHQYQKSSFHLLFSTCFNYSRSDSLEQRVKFASLSWKYFGRSYAQCHEDGTLPEYRDKFRSIVAHNKTSIRMGSHQSLQNGPRLLSITKRCNFRDFQCNSLRQGPHL